MLAVLEPFKIAITKLQKKFVCLAESYLIIKMLLNDLSAKSLQVYTDVPLGQNKAHAKKRILYTFIHSAVKDFQQRMRKAVQARFRDMDEDENIMVNLGLHPSTRLVRFDVILNSFLPF